MCVKMMVDYACFSTSYSSPPIDSFFLARLFLYYVSGILGYFRGRGGVGVFPGGKDHGIWRIFASQKAKKAKR